MESSVDPVLRILVRARRSLTAAALADALAPPAAGFLLVAAAVLAAARWTGREDLPGGLLAAAAILALLAAAARVARGVPGWSDAALHLDRRLGAEERFSTVLETAESDPAVAEWAARGALARAGDAALREALAFRPPAALLPLLLAGTLVAGLGLLPAEARVEAPGAAATIAAPAAVSPAGGGGTTAIAPAAAPVPVAKAGAGEVLRGLEEKAKAAGNAEALREIAAARAALARGEGAEAEGAMGRALAALGAPAAAGAGLPVPGATGSGAAVRGSGAPASADPGFRPLPVPFRAREAVKRYFETGNGEGTSR